MSETFWYVDSAGNRAGPVDRGVTQQLIRNGTIARATLVWTDGMADWSRAEEVDLLRAEFASTPLPSAPLPPTAPSAAGFARRPQEPIFTGALASHVSTWPFLGRLLLLVLGNIVIVAAPWTSTAYWRYTAERTVLPNGSPFRFEGQPKDIWYVFVAQGVLFWMGQVKYAPLLTLPLGVALSYITVKWFCEKLRMGETGRFMFQAGFGAYLGWSVLMLLSFITIIGWAWVFRFYLRFLCRNTHGPVGFDFVGSGLGILWRTFVAVFACALVIPIPWVAVWLQRWFTSQVVVLRPPGSGGLPGAA